MKLKLYKEEEILKAIKDEGLCDWAWGYKTPVCIWVFNDAMEKEDVWKKFKSKLKGFEKASYYNNNCIESVTYFLLENYEGNLNRLSHEVQNPNKKELVFDD